MNRFLFIAFFLLSIFQNSQAQIPTGYYDSANGLSGEALKSALNNIIDGHDERTYDQVKYDLRVTDEDPDNSDNIICLYTGWSYAKSDWDNGSEGWNREHVWSKSHGDFGDSPPAGTDLHHLRPADISVNSAKSNRDFDWGVEEYIDGSGATGCYKDTDIWEPRDSEKGDVARMIFYMATRYEGENGEVDLEIVDYVNTAGTTNQPFYGKLSTLLLWHASDPVDAWEINRNNIIYTDYQHNRNPYIDHPEYVNSIWGSANPEPSNHVTSFSAGSVTSSSIVLTWDDNDGANLADNFFLMINNTGSFTPPVNGVDNSDDTNISNGSGHVNVNHGDETYTFEGLSANTTYYFEIYPNSNSGTDIIYKTDGTIPSDNEITNVLTLTTLPFNETLDINIGSLYTYSVSGDGKVWHWESAFAAMNGYNSGDLEEDWLIIPVINFDNYSDEYMMFDTWYNYGTDDTDNYLKLMYSTNYPGSGYPGFYTWTELSYIKPSTYQTWATSGSIDLSAISGSSVYVAFKYHYNSGSYRSWRVDNISIQEPPVVPEPSNYPTSFVATTNSISSITTNWTDAAGTQLPDGYLVKVNLTGSYSAPVDGTPVLDDIDLSDGEGVANIGYGVETLQWSGLTENTTYYFIIYPYTNANEDIDYKVNDLPPTTSETTLENNYNLIISEVADPNDVYQARFVELYNAGITTIDFGNDTWYLCRQANGGTGWGNIQLAGIINAGESFVVAYSQSTFLSEYGFNSDQSSGYIQGNGNDGYFLFEGGDHLTGNLIDAYGVIDQDGTGEAWEYTNSKAVRKYLDTIPSTSWQAEQWIINSVANAVDMTPAWHHFSLIWTGSQSISWEDQNNWAVGGNNSDYSPDAGCKVIISSTSNQPTISNEASCDIIELNAGVVITISSGSLIIGH